MNNDKINSRQINALKKATANRKADIFVRVNEALKLMKQDEIPISFQSVAKYANVSKTTLYARSELKSLVEQERNNNENINRLHEKDKVILRQKKEISVLTKRVGYLQTELSELKQQLEVIYGKYLTNIK